MTLAIASWAVCDKESEARFIPSCAANPAALPLNRMVGRPPGSRRTSTSVQAMPFFHPVPIAFSAASLAANRAANRSAALRFDRQYWISLG